MLHVVKFFVALNKELKHSSKFTYIIPLLVYVVFSLYLTRKEDKDLRSCPIAFAGIDPCTCRRRAAAIRMHPPFLFTIMQQTKQKNQSKGGISFRNNKWTKSLSQPMFLFSITSLRGVAGTFMVCLIQSWWIKTKLR